MSVQFGKWSLDGQPPDPGYLVNVRTNLARYGPDAQHAYFKDGTAILHFSFHTTKESRRETQPYLFASGAVLTWDGRLDNRTELIRELRESSGPGATDLQLVAGAYEKWGTACFAKLVGDWALAIWDPSDRALLLAKDFLGSRHLYYSRFDNQVTWSTVIDPLVLFAGRTFDLSEEYIAGWLSSFPAAQLTPYIGIDSVPPSSFVLLTAARTTVEKYWDFDPDRRISYGTDAEYEEQFRTIFSQSVARRLRCDSPVLAELSGGMDSSAIVCMADTIVSSDATGTPTVDTLSYYNDSEPNWNERPYFTKIEERRGRIGCHINVGRGGPILPDFSSERFAATPNAENAHSESAEELRAWINARGHRVILSGMGGDEVTGGVPTPIPELADLLARAQLGALPACLKSWALNKKKPWIDLLSETVRGFLPLALVARSGHKGSTLSIAHEFERRHRQAIRSYKSRLRVFGPLPSYQENIATLELLRRELACLLLSVDPRNEKRYPFLDRDLLEFLYAIPREQLVRPHQRRSLMRRSLVNIVPDEVLNRRRKAFVIRAPMLAISEQRFDLRQMAQQMIACSLGMIDQTHLLNAIEDACNGKEIDIAAFMRTVGLESWLRHVQNYPFLALFSTGAPHRNSVARQETLETHAANNF